MAVGVDSSAAAAGRLPNTIKPTRAAAMIEARTMKWRTANPFGYPPVAYWQPRRRIIRFAASVDWLWGWRGQRRPYQAEEWCRNYGNQWSPISLAFGVLHFPPDAPL